jgi:regulator of replication initiation timing
MEVALTMDVDQVNENEAALTGSTELDVHHKGETTSANNPFDETLDVANKPMDEIDLTYLRSPVRRVAMDSGAHPDREDVAKRVTRDSSVQTSDNEPVMTESSVQTNDDDNVSSKDEVVEAVNLIRETIETLRAEVASMKQGFSLLIEKNQKFEMERDEAHGDKENKNKGVIASVADLWKTLNTTKNGKRKRQYETIINRINSMVESGECPDANQAVEYLDTYCNTCKISLFELQEHIDASWC